MAKESVEKEELPEIELPGDLDLGKEETAEEILPAIAEPEAFEVPDTISKLSKELEKSLHILFQSRVWRNSSVRHLQVHPSIWRRERRLEPEI
mgnify:CR=1 FL=1